MAFERQSPMTIVTACDSLSHAANFGDYCAAKSLRGIKPLPLMVLKDSLRQPMCGRGLMTNDNASFPIGLDAAAMVDIL